MIYLFILSLFPGIRTSAAGPHFPARFDKQTGRDVYSLRYMHYDVFFWWSVVSTVVGVILLCFSIWQIAQAQSEKNRKKDQVKIWMQDANGISQALRRIVMDNIDKRYSSTNDMANAIWAIQASAFALYQSLYEERCITEEEFKQQQNEFRQELKKQQEEQREEQKKRQSLVNVPPPVLNTKDSPPMPQKSR